jgi:sarcosine oxidase subunit alpha
MPEGTYFLVTVNGVPVKVNAETTVAAAILMTSATTRRSVNGEPRGPLCGIGICFECRATIDGVQHQRTCQILCADGMEVHTS